jgi:hypothetical protein
MTGEGASRMEWDDGAERVLTALVGMVPETMRPLAEAAGREESEIIAIDRGATAVASDDVVRGWIRVTPPDQRNGLVEVIDGLGFDPELFADELQDLGDWEEEEE